jgi:hypothetical protein
MQDSLLVLQTSATVTSSTNSTGVQLGTIGGLDGKFNARVVYSAATNASGSNSATFLVEHSDDNSTYYTLTSGAAEIITLSTTAQAGEINLSFRTQKPYVRLVTTIAGAGSTPTITREAYITQTRP